MKPETISLLNAASLFGSTLLCFLFLLLSVRPYRLEAEKGIKAWAVCQRYRLLAGLLMVVIFVNYVVYLYYPLPLGLPLSFPIPLGATIVMAAVLAAKPGAVWKQGVEDAGGDDPAQDESPSLYGGIYERVRHPQAVGEYAIWILMGFAMNSPFLALYSLIWIPVALAVCRAEEKDMLFKFGKEYEEYRNRTPMFIPKGKPAQ